MDPDPEAPPTRAHVLYLLPNRRRAPFTCIGCLDIIPLSPSQSRWVIENADYCDTCVRGRWQAIADAGGTQWAPRDARAVYDLEDFRGLLPGPLVRAVEAARAVFAVPLDERVWCPHVSPETRDRCNGFVGRRGAAGEPATVRDCPACGQAVCLRCGGEGGGEGDRGHECRVAPRDDRNPMSERGHTYQNCPNCDVLIVKSQGCNHMSCEACATQFCFICGERHEDEPPGRGEHWQYPSDCSRYNHAIPRRGDNHPMWGVDDFFNSEWIAATLFDHQAVQHNASHFPHHEILTEYERQVFEHEGEFAATEQDLIFEPIDLDTQSRWREGALRVIEIHDRFRQNFPNSFYALWATERDEARRTWNRRFVKLLAMTRQVLTGAHNMLGSPGPSRDPDSIVRRATRRILLAHNVKIMRELWLEYRQGGTDDYAGRLLRNDPSWDHIMELANPLQIDTDGVEVSRDQLEQLISAFDPPKPSSPGRKGESWDSPRGRMVYAAQDLGERLRSIVPFFMKPGPLSIADSIILRDLRGLVRGSLLTIEYGVGLGVFRDHDRSHQMALSMTDGLLRGINETQDPTETTQGVRGFWADSKQWSEDLQLALCEEQILLDDAQVRVPDDMWHLFEFLDRLHPWIDRQHENPTWAASSQDRPALEEGVQGLWRVYRRRPWAGPLSPVFGRALDRLKDVMHQYSNREMTVGLGVPEWRGRRWSERLGDVARTNGPPEYRPLDGYGGPADLTYVRLFHEHQQAECIRMLQQGEEVSYRVRRRLQITEAMMHLQIRLLVPDVHDGEDNSEMTRRVWEFCRRVRRGEGDDGQFPQWSRGDASLYEVLIHHLLDAATHREETNPTQATVMPAVWRGFVALYQQTAQELEAARVSDAGFLVGIRHALVQHEEELCARWGFDEWQGYGLMALLDQASRCVVLAESEEWMRQQAWGRVFVGEFWQMYRLRKNLDGEMAWGAYRGVRVVAAMARVDGIVQRLIGAMAGPSNDRAALERRCVQVTGIALEDIPRPRGRHGVVDHGGWFEFAVGG